jgi:hypothetical protein
MSLHAFQTELARLIVDPDFRERVQHRGADELDANLSALEQSRLCQIAADPGLDINRTLHKGFRLGKLRALLPLTCQLLGSGRLAREVSAFWAERAPSSFYFIPEALEFCDFLVRRKIRNKYLSEVLAYERATLELEKARHDNPPPQTVRFQHDPRVLLTALAAGRRPRAVPLRPSLALGKRDSHAGITWQLS